MLFVVQEKDEPFPADLLGTEFVLLRRDSWDDYGFKTTFSVEVYHPSKEMNDIGTVKVLRKGQQGGYTLLPARSFEELGVLYCALGQSLSYYEALYALGPSVYRRILSGLRDVVFRPSIRGAFLEEPGFETSLERFGSSARAIEDAAYLFSDSDSDAAAAAADNEGSEVRLSFASNVGGSTFTTDFVFNDVDALPARINAVIGYNGTGKTRLLANLAMVAHADLPLRSRNSFADRYGRFVSNGKHRFGAVVVISYSAFDTFEVPGRDAMEIERLVRSGDVFGYVYCGLRKFSDSQQVEQRKSHRALDSSEAHTLKSIGEISNDFFDALARTAKDVRRRTLLAEALKPIIAEPSFARLGVSLDLLNQDGFRRQVFPALSTGHKIVLNIVTHLAAHLERQSLVLLDEPESHLHPPMLAALLQGVNVLLSHRDSFAVIATHSPVVLQEVPRRYVRVLRRQDNRTLVHDPEIETFGENVGALTRYVFDLDNTMSDYHSTLDRLARSLSMSEIDLLFGGEGMSAQARAYVRAVQRAQEKL
ncbi:AAA family ATPase [Micromonospora aurantiaca]|uniref:AAA family ATPase n=1 Tax=Micromonospora aurantiaca (nom. illeg.) TaxID=47850 RepID=UPI0033C13949